MWLKTVKKSTYGADGGFVGWKCNGWGFVEVIILRVDT